MKIYNLCEEKNYADYKLAILEYNSSYNSYYMGFSHSYYTSAFYCFYISFLDKIHRIGGPALKFKNRSLLSEYYIDGNKLSKKAYYKHPEMLKYKFLKTHPELQGFI